MKNYNNYNIYHKVKLNKYVSNNEIMEEYNKLLPLYKSTYYTFIIKILKILYPDVKINKKQFTRRYVKYDKIYIDFIIDKYIKIYQLNDYIDNGDIHLFYITKFNVNEDVSIHTDFSHINFNQLSDLLKEYNTKFNISTGYNDETPIRNLSELDDFILKNKINQFNI